MHSTEEYRKAFNSYMAGIITTKEPLGLYEPISYILELGGKRLRPIMLLMSTEAFGGDHRNALDAALAIEVFHNFSLVHDDIMDAAPLRRGQMTVHEKWDTNTAILSGDAMLINSYQLFESYEAEVFQSLMKLFSKTALQVCEGQQYDVDFEIRNDVTISEYIHMIKYKTAVLVAAAMKMGAIISGVSDKDQDLIYDFGIHIGIAFQLQDDFLDAFGDPETFGKKTGGDIVANKKTILYLNSMKMASELDRKELENLFSSDTGDNLLKIESVKRIYEDSGAASMTKKEIERHTEAAFDVLNDLTIPEAAKEMLATFGKHLMTRKV